MFIYYENPVKMFQEQAHDHLFSSLGRALLEIDYFCSNIPIFTPFINAINGYFHF